METPIVKESKVSTGILGLDAMSEGGINSRDNVLIYGPPGTGKSLMSFEILYKNAKINIPSTYISTEEEPKNIIKDAKKVFTYFDDIDNFIDSKMIVVEYKDTENVLKSSENWQTFLAEINKIFLSNKSQLVVIDSITPIRTFATGDREFTIAVNSMVKNLNDMKVTSITTLQTPFKKAHIDDAGLFGSYMFDGIISLNLEEILGSTQYIIEIVEMKGLPYKIPAKPYELTPKGYNVFR